MTWSSKLQVTPPACHPARTCRAVTRDEHPCLSEECASGAVISPDTMACALGAMFALSGDLVAVATAEGRLVEVNPGCERALGYSAAELCEMHTSDLAHPEDRAALDGMLEDSAESIPATGGVPWVTQHEGRMVTRDGEVKHIHWSIYHDVERQIAYWLGRDITEQLSRTRELERALSERETLLKEIHHRIKNHLAIVAQLLLSELDQVEDSHARVVLKDSAARVQTIARIHESIYNGPSLAAVNLRILIERMMHSLAHTYALGPSIVLELDIEPIITATSRAVPMALVINELVTNTLNHAFANRATGRVDVVLHREPCGRVALRVADDGIGFDFERARAAGSIGLDIVTTLVREQLGGSWETSSMPSKGTEHLIVFPSL